jgi:hypothetical protein
MERSKEGLESTPVLKGKSIDMFCRSLLHGKYSAEKEAFLKRAETTAEKYDIYSAESPQKKRS